jgi:hypothetical protein
MKKSVVICDEDQGRCRSLADRSCPLCENDFCNVHLKADLSVLLAVRRPGAPQPGQAPFAPGQEKFDTNNAEEIRIRICNGCFMDLNQAQRGVAPKYEHTPVLKLLADGLEPQMIETCRAAIATYKLGQSAQKEK